ncbi:MAG: hypothetical protein JW927_01405 [Deltaproteobacteria bacterium]|nr:hypothetical protein [Deltaproteobacteria bacterium]
MKYLEMLKGDKKDKNTIHDQLTELPKDTYDSFVSAHSRHIPENSFDREIDRTIFEFNEKLSSNYEMKVIPEGFTHRTLELEEQFTLAANQGDLAAFRDLLSQWREAWLSLMIKRAVVYH